MPRGLGPSVALLAEDQTRRQRGVRRRAGREAASGRGRRPHLLRRRWDAAPPPTRRGLRGVRRAFLTRERPRPVAATASFRRVLMPFQPDHMTVRVLYYGDGQ